MTWVSNENDYLEEEPMILAPVSAGKRMPAQEVEQVPLPAPERPEELMLL